LDAAIVAKGPEFTRAWLGLARPDIDEPERRQ
jgi:hypothetical protein